MARNRRVDVKGILANPDLRRKLMVSTIQATQAREGIETTPEQAEQAYYVVTESDQTAFFDLQRYRGGGDKRERREEMFVRALRLAVDQVRFDVARRDFTTIDTAPLAYRRIGLAGPIFREHVALSPGFADVRIGHQTFSDERFVRYWWEVEPAQIGPGKKWPRFAKGGSFSRFYSDVILVVRWDSEARAAYAKRKSNFNVLLTSSAPIYLHRSGLTWPLAAKTFNVRAMPEGCIFAHKGPAIFPTDLQQTDYLCSILNSSIALYLLKVFVSREEIGGRWEAGAVSRIPIASPNSEDREKIGDVARVISSVKAGWDRGNETCTSFTLPWLLQTDLVDEARSITERLSRLAAFEATEEQRLRELYDRLDDDVYYLYGITDVNRAVIDETLGERPPEVLWPQMEGKGVDQKRMEHVWRLLAHVVRRVLETDDDGIVTFTGLSGEAGLLDRIHRDLAGLFPGNDATQIEAEIANELKRSVTGYKRANSIREWLDNVFFAYHVSLYKNRPIFWHIASSQGSVPAAFGALVHYHEFDKNRMARLRSTYLREAMDNFRREAALADKEGRADDRVEWQAKLEEAQELDRRLQWVQEGHHEGPEAGDKDYRILTPWKKPHERPKGWDPDLDDGVKVNIAPLQKAGVLRVAKVV